MYEQRIDFDSYRIAFPDAVFGDIDGHMRYTDPSYYRAFLPVDPDAQFRNIRDSFKDAFYKITECIILCAFLYIGCTNSSKQ